MQAVIEEEVQRDNTASWQGGGKKFVERLTLSFKEVELIKAAPRRKRWSLIKPLELVLK